MKTAFYDVSLERASEESLASADESIDETRSVMSFILSRLPEHASVSAAATAALSGAGSTATSTTPPSHKAATGDGGVAVGVPLPFPVELRKRQIPWAAMAAHIPRLLRMLVLLAAHAVLIMAFTDTGWDPKEPWCQGSGLLLLLLATLDACLLYTRCLRWLPRKKAAVLADRARKRASLLADRKWTARLAAISWVLVWAGALVFIAIDSRLHPPRITAGFGMLVLVGFGYIFSKHRSKIRWRPVLCGFLLQFALGLLLVRWKVGRGALACIADKMTRAISLASHGGRFVFGYLTTGQLEGGMAHQQPVLAFTIVSTVVSFGLLVSVLCHYGLLQCLALRFGRIMSATMGTTACESFCAASNVFLGMADSTLLVKPYLVRLTRSEIHCVMTCGFATISGSLFAVFMTLGVKAEHMLAASVMSAPAALGFSKLLYPETEDACNNLDISDVRRRSRPECTVLESMARAVSVLLMVSANVVASLVGFLACMAFADALLAQLGALMGWHFVTLNWLLSRLFVPLALAMGVSMDECSHVASLVGLKTALSEVVAYGQMSELAQKGLLSLRAQLICTHALCGFSSVGAIGVQLGVCAALAPQRLPDCARVAGRALTAGSAACFMTACAAGALTDTAAYEVPMRFNSYDFL